MGRNLPNGDRVFVQLTIGKTKFVSKMKTGTASFLGLKPVDPPPKVKKRKARGFKGTQSYKLLFTSAHTIGGASVKSVDIPVSPKVKFEDFYSWAKSHSAVGGIITPWGIKYAWKQTAKTGSSGSGGGGLIGAVENAIGGALSNIQQDFSGVGSSAGGALGSYLGGALAGQTGSQIGGALGSYLGSQL